MKNISRNVANNLTKTGQLKANAWAYPIFVWTVLAICTSNKGLTYLSLPEPKPHTEIAWLTVEPSAHPVVDNNESFGENIPVLRAKSTLY